jgi:hypothetical protein
VGEKVDRWGPRARANTRFAPTGLNPAVDLATVGANLVFALTAIRYLRTGGYYDAKSIAAAGGQQAGA